MKVFIFSLALLMSAVSSSAFAANPCTSIVLKQIKCQVVDATNNTSADISVTRAVTTGGSSSFCSKGVIEESLIIIADFQSDGSIPRSDLLFPSTKIVNPMATLERNGAFDVELYSAGQMLQDLQSTVSMSSVNGATTANLSLQARNLKIFSANQTPVTINGSAACQESLN